MSDRSFRSAATEAAEIAGEFVCVVGATLREQFALAWYELFAYRGRAEAKAGVRIGLLPHFFDAGRVGREWSAGGDVGIESGRVRVVAPSGGGVVTIDKRRLRFTSVELGHESERLLLLASMHAKEHWGGAVKLRGPGEFLFRSAVADEMVGVKTLGYKIPRRRRGEAEALKAAWQPELEQLVRGRAAAASRPAAGVTVAAAGLAAAAV